MSHFNFDELVKNLGRKKRLPPIVFLKGDNRYIAAKNFNPGFLRNHNE